MMIEVFRCPVCKLPAPRQPKDTPFACRNPECGRETTPMTFVERDALIRARSLVYYLAFGDRIKIGVTTDLKRRLEGLPYDELLAFERGDWYVEQARHKQFASTLVPGQREWFFRSPELLAHIAKLSEGMTDVAAEASRTVKRALLGLL